MNKNLSGIKGLFETVKKRNPEARRHYDELQFNCPYCKDKGRHFGFNIVKGVGNCFKCQSIMSTLAFLKMFLGVSYKDATYRFSAMLDLQEQKVETFSRKKPKVFDKKPQALPGSPEERVSVAVASGIMGDFARAYLSGRGVDYNDRPERFIFYPNDKENWSKIFFPLYYKGRIIYWVKRNFIGFGSFPPMGAPKVAEGKLTKTDVVYGLDDIDPSEPVVVVEGVFDALTTPNSVALLGKKMSANQRKLILELKPKRIVIFLDADASKAAVKLAKRFSLKVPSSVVVLPDTYRELDPNDCRDCISAVIKSAIPYDVDSTALAMI